LQVGHSGSNRGYRGRLIVYPATGDGAVVLTNGYGGGVLASEILRAVAEAYGWPGARWNPKEKESITVGRDTLARYVGVYRSASGREVTVQRAGDGLRASMPVIGNDLTLVPMSPRRFFVTEIDAEVEFDASGGSGKQAVDVFIGGDRRWMTATRVQ
jgi:hypothetical protein